MSRKAKCFDFKSKLKHQEIWTDSTDRKELLGEQLQGKFFPGQHYFCLIL